MDALLVLFLLLSFLSGATCQDHAADAQEDHSIQTAILKELADTVNNLQKDMQSMKDQLAILNDGYLSPFQSCWQIAEAHPSAKSGYYWVQDSGTGQTVQVYCDMDSHCCNSTGGWMRVANVDMTDPTQQCPPEFTLKTENGVRACGRKGGFIGCTSTTFSSHGIEYDRVCGRIRAYQYGGPDAFEGGVRSIDMRYVDGISITHGSSPRKHIWTFAAASSEYYSNRKACPCTRTDQSFTGTVPSFIEKHHYFCDTAVNMTVIDDIDIKLYTDDPLWDGQGCGPTSSCCSFNNPPWFCTQLPQPTTDDIELRMCGHRATTHEDTPFDQIELYIQNEDVNNKTNIESLTSKVDSLCDETKSLASAMNSLSTRTNSLTSKVDSLNNSLTSKVDSLSTWSDSLTSKVDSLSASSGSLTSKVDSLSTRSDSLTSKVDSLSTKSDSLTSKVDSLSTRSDLLTSKVDSLSTRSDSLTSKVDSLSTKSDSLTSKVDSFTVIAESVREEHDSLKTVTVAVSERVESLHDKVDIQARKLTNSTQNVCPITDSTCTEVIRNETAEILQGQRSIQKYLSSRLNPFPSCWYIAKNHPSAKSGYYWVHSGTEQAVEVYCDMESHYFNSTRGWMRVANVDMTDPTQQCPSEFTLRTVDGRRTCGRPGPHDCTSTTFPSHGIEYSQVCGRIRAYQFGWTVAYYSYHEYSGHTIDSNYVDGISITHGNYPRKHIWTFAAALSKYFNTLYACPCTRTDQNFTGAVPSFIENDYFCDTAVNSGYGLPDNILYTDDPLWDGQGCGPNSSCCSFNNPPWFCTQLPQPTTDDIELRMCDRFASSYAGTPFDQIELYVWNEGPSKVNSLATKTAEILQRQYQLQKSVTYLDSLPSCRHRAEAYPREESGYYWVRNGTGQAVEVYCDMDSHCCNSTGGWMRVANVDMTDPTQQCPPEVTLNTLENGVRVCGRDNGSIGCTSTNFSSHGVEYGRVCGRIRAYQFGRPGAFSWGSIDDYYVDGISITHGSSPRKHIWTFAAALSEYYGSSNACPCTRTDQTFTGTVPSFIGNDYFCDTAVNASYAYPDLILYTGDPLWDGQGCGPTSSCCSFNNPPWFCTQLPQPTTDDIELRMCSTRYKDTPFDQIELYIQ